MKPQIHGMSKARRPDHAPTDLPGDAAPSTRGFAENPAAYQEQTGGDEVKAENYEHGREVIRRALKTMPRGPGVYRMINSKGDALYVGKAKNLRNRVQNYVNASGLTFRTMRMIALTAAMEVVSTHTEVEALLLESNMIKRLRPRYNVLLRDDKSFPFVLITGDHEWPQITKHRGARSRKGRYFGPFASAGAVNRTLNALQKAFPIRPCTDSVFSARTRPCLQYQIRRCTAPCVGRIDAEDYANLVDEVTDFLSGRSHRVQEDLKRKMTAASEALEFETAALYRDRLKALAHIQSHQGINVTRVEDADIIAIAQEGGQSCVQVFFFRAGQNWGNRAYFPSHGKDQGPEEVLTAFLGQFYDDKPPPREILVNEKPHDADLIADALSTKADRRVRVHRPQRGTLRELVQQAHHNAREALGRRLAESATQRRLLDEMTALLEIDGQLDRIEVYDNSHIQGTNAIGAMIVAGPDGFVKNGYRKFNIKSSKLTPGDDYAMMREVLTRRFSRLLRSADEDANGENSRIAGEWPDLVLIDGGKGQLSAALDVMNELGITSVAVAAVSKGPDRNAGREQIHLPDRAPMLPAQRSAVLYFIQRLRDEAHRFAIGTHRKRRAKGVGASVLDEIEGIGPRRKRALLNHFGSAREVERAALSDLQALDGISGSVAKKIYDFFHPDD